MGVIAGLLDLLFPSRCAFCRKILQKGERGMCAKCETDISRTSAAGKQTGDFFTACYSPLYYEGDVRDSILRFKFSDATAYAGIYGKIIADCITNDIDYDYGLISWVPLSAKRLKKRGYDQSMLIAMAAALELDDVAVETIIKHTDVPAQSATGSEEKRRANISGAYKVSDPELIADRKILLVDDIVTTGATLSECARTLLMGGASEVVCVTLARTQD